MSLTTADPPTIESSWKTMHACTSPSPSSSESVDPRPPVWGTATRPPMPPNLEDVMSEQLAKELQFGNSDFVQPRPAAKSPDLAEWDVLEDETDNDFLLAQMLQHEFDREHDAMLKKEEEKFNGNSKVKVSFKNHQLLHPILQDDVDSTEELEYYEEKQKAPPQFNKSGTSGKGKNIITKHDSIISSEQNATRLMAQLPPNIATGDDYKFHMRLPHRVYNELKQHSQGESKKRERVHERKEHATSDLVVDPKTRLIMYKLVNSGSLEKIDGTIASGKESVVYHAVGTPEGGTLTEYAVKVFKTTLSEFKNRCQYIVGDSRYFKDRFHHQNPRKIMKIWATKEDNNLRRMYKYGIPCPQVLQLKKHVLVMSFLGENNVSAPQLKEAQLSFAELCLAYKQCLELMAKMYKPCGLIHADLSEYNMLWFKGQVYFIDVAQAVEREHPMGHKFLLRDCQNICRFFENRGLTDVVSPYDLFNNITGLNLQGTGEYFLAQIEDYEKNEEKLQFQQGKDYPFEFFFDKAAKEGEEQRKEMLQGNTEDDWETVTDSDSDLDGKKREKECLK